MKRMFGGLLVVLAMIALLLLALTTQPWVSPVKAEAATVDPKALADTVKYLSVNLYPRSFDHPNNLAAAAQYIQTKLTATGAQVSTQDVLVDGEHFQNVIAHFGPAKGKLLVIGAHYDSFGNGDINNPQTHTPGADDNASGVAGLIGLAELLVKQPPSQPVELIAYTLEEPPNFRTENMGSRWHAKQLVHQGTPAVLMLSLEMIGYFSDTAESQLFPITAMKFLYPSTGNFISLVSRSQDVLQTRQLKAVMQGTTNLPVYSINTSPAVTGVDFSDHQSYWLEKMPAIMITDTAFNRNTQYHHAGDTFERLDYGRMAKVVQGVFAFAQQWH